VEESSLREGSKGWLESRFWAGRVQTSHGFHEGRNVGKEIWLLVEWPDEAAEPTKYFFSDLPVTYGLRRLVQVAKARWKIEPDYQQLKQELGLDQMRPQLERVAPPCDARDARSQFPDA
jgi:SRSO17 transposase